MKKLKFLFGMLLIAALTVSLNACSDDDPQTPETPEVPDNPDEPDNPDNPDNPTTEKSYHFDIWIALERHGGMGRDVKTLVRSVESLEADQPTIDFVGEGTEVNYKLSLEAIIKGAYYYQIPVESDRFGKYTLSDNTIYTIQEQKFGVNTYATRKYTHAWMDDNTLVIMAGDGDAKNIIWTKLDADLNILDEGTLNISVPENMVFTTSGILAYRETDNKLVYFYYKKAAKGMNATASKVHTAIINPTNMEVESDIESTFIDEMVGSAYGELLQKCTFTDESGNLYLACLTNDEDGVERSHLMRINAGENDFDLTYDAFTNDGKLVSVEYLGNGKVLGYAREDVLGTGIDSYSHYYTIIDLNTKTNTPIECDGQRLPYSGGRFSQRTAVVNGKAYLGTHPEDANPCIYIYDIATGTTTKGREIAEGYYFEQIRVLENLE